MPKKVKKRVKIKIIPVLFFIISAVLLYFLFNYLVDTKIKNIIIYNNKILTDQEVIELANIENYPSFYKTFSKNIKKNLKQSPYIKEVKVKKKFFNILELYIYEYIPLFIKDDELVLENNVKVDLINYKAPILSNLEENEIYKSLIKAMLKLKESARCNISQIIYSPNEYDDTRFLLYMDDGNHVYINILKFENLNYYDEIYPTLNNKKGTLYLDSGNHFEIFK